VDKQNRHVWIVIAFALSLASFLIVKSWKTSDGTISAVKAKPEFTEAAKTPVSLSAFFGQIFKDIKPPQYVGSILMRDPKKISVDSINILLKWAAETGNIPLQAWTGGKIALRNPTETNITEAARNDIFSAVQMEDDPTISNFLFQEGKKFIDRGMAENPKNVPLRNALITYLSIYENAPMKFLGVLRETLAIDSTNIETHYIHLNLLKKSGQWEKALNKCQKLISLQPQNPDWLFELSNIYGTKGDSVNAKVYLNLAVKVRNQQKKN